MFTYSSDNKQEAYNNSSHESKYRISGVAREDCERGVRGGRVGVGLKGVRPGPHIRRCRAPPKGRGSLRLGAATRTLLPEVSCGDLAATLVPAGTQPR